MNVIQEADIRHILRDVQPGDILEVYSKGLYGFAIRRLLSRGMYRCFTNHTAPCWLTPTGTPMMLQIEPPKAYMMPLAPYLMELYKNSGKAILLRPDALTEDMDGRKRNQAYKWLAEEWKKMDGVEYDKYSIRQILRMMFRYWPWKKENDKTKIYCTEGTVFPLMENPYVPWQPDVLRNESYPAPIHVEHLVRQERLRFIAGNEKLYEKIRYAGQAKSFELIGEARALYQDVKIIHNSKKKVK